MAEVWINKMWCIHSGIYSHEDVRRLVVCRKKMNMTEDYCVECFSQVGVTKEINLNYVFSLIHVSNFYS